MERSCCGAEFIRRLHGKLCSDPQAYRHHQVLSWPCHRCFAHSGHGHMARTADGHVDAAPRAKMLEPYLAALRATPPAAKSPQVSQLLRDAVAVESQLEALRQRTARNHIMHSCLRQLDPQLRDALSLQVATQRSHAWAMY